MWTAAAYRSLLTSTACVLRFWRASSGRWPRPISTPMAWLITEFVWTVDSLEWRAVVNRCWSSVAGEFQTREPGQVCGKVDECPGLRCVEDERCGVVGSANRDRHQERAADVLWCGVLL